MVHGFLSSNSQWLANIDALGQVCTPVTAELWGHGKSPSPSAVWLYEPEQYVSQFEIIRKALSAEQWFVCGYSLGAALTARYSCIYPERVKGHIMTNSNSAFANTEQVEEWKKTGDEIFALKRQTRFAIEEATAKNLLMQAKLRESLKDVESPSPCFR